MRRSKGQGMSKNRLPKERLEEADAIRRGQLLEFMALSKRDDVSLKDEPPKMLAKKKLANRTHRKPPRASTGRAPSDSPGRVSQGATYQVKFFKKLMSSDGHCFKVLQRVVAIKGADSDQDAIRTAKQRFERLEQVPDWCLHADCIEATVEQ